MMWKFFYVIARNCGLFSLPGFNTLRNIIYRKHLNADGIIIDSFVRIQKLHASSHISSFGKDLHVGYGALLDLSGGVTAGERVTISEGAKIYTHTHHIHGGELDWRKNEVQMSHLSIGDDVWIATNAIILSSVNRIGDGAIISSGCVLTKDVGNLEIVAGIPARVIGKRKVDA